VSEEHADLHHEPVRRTVHAQLLVEDQKVEDGHPAKEPYLEEG